MNKVYMVTGATSGLGKAIALELAKTGETVILVARDAERAAQVEKEISTALQNPNLDTQICDLSNLSSVRNLGTVLLSRYNNIHVLINNAAIYRRTRGVTIDGYETMFATNHLGPFLLTYMLLDRLVASDSARIINITAPSTTELNFDDLQGERSFTPLNAFGATKMANLLFTFELARRMENTGVRVNAFHPGPVRTRIMKDASLPVRLLTWLISSSPDPAAREVVRLALSPEFENTHGKFLTIGKELDPPGYALDQNLQRRLWEISEQLTKAPEQGPNYDPTGSVAMFDDRDIPEGLIRPEDDQVPK